MVEWFNSNIAAMKKFVFPFYMQGKVVKGFGRGSKELGIPTANFEESVVKSLPDDAQSGIYFGWAQVENLDVRKMVMSIGWNPFYDNKERSIETHILHKFDRDFYGSNLKTIILGSIRPEKNFPSVDLLILEINNDINIASHKLDMEPSLSFKKDSFFNHTIEDKS